MGFFVPIGRNILDPIGRNFARKEHTKMQKVFIRKVPLRFYAKRKFCAYFEVHVYKNKKIKNLEPEIFHYAPSKQEPPPA